MSLRVGSPSGRDETTGSRVSEVLTRGDSDDPAEKMKFLLDGLCLTEWVTGPIDVAASFWSRW